MLLSYHVSYICNGDWTDEIVYQEYFDHHANHFKSLIIVWLGIILMKEKLDLLLEEAYLNVAKEIYYKALLSDSSINKARSKES